MVSESSTATDQGFPMQLECPNCHRHLEVVDAEALDDAQCESCGSVLTIGDKAPETPRMFGRYELLTRLGVGAFGEVWKAKDPKLQRTVAIKIPRKEQVSERELELTFREARAAAQLKHPHIVAVFDIGSEGDKPFIVSEYVEGITLGEYLRRRLPAAETTAELMVKVAEALHQAHGAGVIHRDLKPSNIMLDKTNEPRLLDFGLAKRESGEITMTADGQILGTPAYMAPEQARGEGHLADARTDIFSLGVILFELLTGQPPYGGNQTALIHKIQAEEPPYPRDLRPDVPVDLERITLRCLEKEPANRYQTAQQLANDLRAFLNEAPISPPQMPLATRLKRLAKRNKALTAALVIVTCLLLVTALAWVAKDLLVQPSAPTQPEHAAASFENHFGDVWDVAISPDGNRIASGDAGGTLRIWKADEGILKSLNDPPLEIECDNGHIWELTFSNDSKWIAVAGNDRTVKVFASDTGQVEWQTTLKDDVKDLDYSPNGQFLAVGSSYRTVVLDAANGEQISELPEGVSWLVRFGPGGKSILSTRIAKGHIWEIVEYPISEDGKTFGEATRVMRFSRNQIYDFAVGPTGHVAAAGREMLRLWPPNSTDAITLDTPCEVNWSVALSNDGRWLASGGDDGHVRLWPTSEPRTLREFAPHIKHTTIWIRGIQLAKSGDYILSGGSDSAIFVTPNRLELAKQNASRK